MRRVPRWVLTFAGGTTGAHCDRWRDGRLPADVRVRILPTLLGIVLVSCGLSTPVRCDTPSETPSLGIRVTWGGGRPRAWRGVMAIEVREDRGRDEAPLPPRGRFDTPRTLAVDEAANASFHVDRGRILLHAPRPRAFDGIDLTLHEWSDAFLTIELRPDDGGEASVKRFSVPLDEVVTARLQEPLDEEGNRLVVTRAPGDDIRIRFPSHAGERCPTLRSPGDALEIHVQPVVRAAATRGEHTLRARLVDATGETSLFEAEIPVGRAGDEPTGLRPLREVPLVVPMPSVSGGYEIQFSVAETGSLRWSRPVATRSVAVAVIDRSPRPNVPEAGREADVLYELDPGSPRLIERLRRLPGMSSTPSVTLPQVPAMQAMPKLPSNGFGFPSRQATEGFRIPSPLGGNDSGLLSAVRGLESLVPRGGGLLAHGFSSLETHPLGPVLRLPPAAKSTEPAWEAVAIPSALPGQPHLLEIEYPSDQRATLAVAVLETDASGALLPPVRSSGFHIEPLPLTPQPPTLGTFLLPFWPATRSPVVVVANPSTTTPAVIGKLRVRSGEATLAMRAGTDSASRRPVRGVLAAPSFRELGVTPASDPLSGQRVETWSGLIAGADRLADLLLARGAGGAMVSVYADGAACWPTTAAAESPQWDGGAFAMGGPDPVRKDVVSVLSRAFDRRNLELVPGIDCSGPIAELEEIAARGGPLAMGLECTGPDGSAQPPAEGVRRYNPLDPRVQDAVVRIADDLASHVAGRTAVQSIAIVVSPDGWLHLPGTASCLDDATFARFARECGLDMPSNGADRFAERARLVEGPAREVWLAWRARRMAAFFRRIAEVVAGRDGTLDLHVVVSDLAETPADPSTTPASGSQRLLEAGIAPGLIASHPRIVFVAPHVTADPLDLGGLAGVERLAAAVSAVVRDDRTARLGAIATHRAVPVELSGIVRHLGGGSKPSASTRIPFEAIPTGPTAARPLAESLGLGDLECFYDGSLLDGFDAESVGLAHDFAAMPAGRMDRLPGVAAPLVVRSTSDGRSTWIALANPSPLNCTVRVTASGCATPPGALPPAPEADRNGASDSWSVSLRPWETRVLQAQGAGTVVSCEPLFEPQVRERLERSLESLARRRAMLEAPPSLEGLDNPSFDVPWTGATLPGWELVDPAKGALTEADGPEDGRALTFTSTAPVASLRSNPFPAPPTGRVSVAAKLRTEPSDAVPPVRIAVEGTLDGVPYYRFADVGGRDADSQERGTWRSVVLQIDHIPHGLDALRVRFDLLGPGAVTIDDVRIYGLAFEESQRIQLAKFLAAVDQHIRDGGIATAARELDGYWPRFLQAFVPDQPPTTAAENAIEPPSEPERRAGVMDRLRRWWR